MKILVHLHLYYVEQWGLMREHLQSLEGINYDLYITHTEDNPELLKKIESFKSDAHILKVKNLGYDVGPFFEVLKMVDLDNYDYCIKLHTKRDFPGSVTVNCVNLSGARWRNCLLSFLKDKATFFKALHAFEHDQTLGMVGCKPLICIAYTKTRREYEKWMLHETQTLLSKLSMSPNPKDRCIFIAGTMFMVRASLLKPLKSLNFNIDDFTLADRTDYKDLAHVMEYLLGWLITSSLIPGSSEHYSIADPYSSKTRRCYWALCRYLRKLRRFVLRVQTDEDTGITQIKLFKIPVFTLKAHDGQDKSH